MNALQRKDVASDAKLANVNPGAVDGYQINFRIPDGTTAGQASLRLSSAWISGPEAKIPVQ